MRAALAGLLSSASAAAWESEPPPPPPATALQTAEVEDHAPDLPVEAQRDTDEARSASRVSFSASFGVIADPGVPGAGSRLGPSFAFSKPFYMGTRRRYVQFLNELRVGAGWVPDKFVLLQMSPMWGTNFYFGPYLGLETRLGLGFGAKLSSVSAFGVSTQAETGIVFRVFKDDRTRLKLLAGVGIQLFTDATIGGLSAYLGAGFETAL